MKISGLSSVRRVTSSRTRNASLLPGVSIRVTGNANGPSLKKSSAVLVMSDKRRLSLVLVAS